jgi:hypothetical protein
MPIRCSCDWDYGEGWIEIAGMATIFKKSKCCECYQVLKHGDLCEISHTKRVFDDIGELITDIYITCPICAEIREKMSGDCAMWFSLWEDVEIAIDCDNFTIPDLDGLSEAARNKLFPIMEKMWEEQEE